MCTVFNTLSNQITRCYLWHYWRTNCLCLSHFSRSLSIIKLLILPLIRRIHGWWAIFGMHAHKKNMQTQQTSERVDNLCPITDNVWKQDKRGRISSYKSANKQIIASNMQFSSCCSASNEETKRRIRNKREKDI